MTATVASAATGGIETRDAALGRLRGGRVGATFGALWALYGLSAFSETAKLAGGLLILVLWVLTLREARRLARAARTLPPAENAGGRHRAIGFVAILVLEIALMNVAVWLLSAEPLHIYWPAAIALVVGLHFAPLALLFRLRAFWGTAAAMTVLAVLAIAVIRSELASPAIVNSLLGFANALVLWITAASGFADVRAAVTGPLAAV